LLSMDQHIINIGRYTYGEDPSLDSSDSPDNSRTQNVAIRPVARQHDLSAEEDDQSVDTKHVRKSESSDELMYQDPVTDTAPAAEDGGTTADEPATKSKSKGPPTKEHEDNTHNIDSSEMMKPAIHRDDVKFIDKDQVNLILKQKG
jgi:hypothetical protein